MSGRRLTALRRLARIVPAAGCSLAAFSCAKSSTVRDDSQEREHAVVDRSAREAFPFIRIDAERGVIEVDGIVPIDCHHPHTPHIYLEVVACAPDTREHEALVMTRATPSHLHAAMLALGWTAGALGSWAWRDGAAVYAAPTGDEVEVLLRVARRDGSIDERPAREWIVDVDTGERPPARPFVFAGSRFVERAGAERYDADGAGNVIGLATFGNEVIAWSEVFSPESAVDAPRWIADRSVVPEFGTPVTIVLKRPE